MISLLTSEWAPEVFLATFILALVAVLGVHAWWSARRAEDVWKEPLQRRRRRK